MDAIRDLSLYGTGLDWTGLTRQTCNNNIDAILDNLFKFLLVVILPLSTLLDFF